jgi:hypothetical protein
MRTYCELEKNRVGMRENEKRPSSPPKLKRKKMGAAMTNCMQFLFPKQFVTNFGLG